MSADFLDFIQPVPEDWYTEVRSIKDGTVRQNYHSAHGMAQWEAETRSEEGWDAYYGVLPRTEKAGDKPYTDEVWVLWADLDAKTSPKFLSLQSLVQYAVPPSVIVDSGHGYHAYWRLERPIEWDLATVLMRGIARQLGGDHVYDSSRILRLPNTTNWKDPEKPMPVRVIRFDTTRLHKASDFDQAYESAIQTEYRRRVSRERLERPVEGRTPLPEWLDTLIRDGAPQGTRSEASFRVVCNLLEHGYSDEEIIEVFETETIGEKYREKRKDGLRWLYLTIRNARSSVG